jgi:magnesium transporter
VDDVAALRDARTHATDRVPVARPQEVAGAVRARLIGARFECADDVAVVEGDGLVGIVPIERLLSAPENARLGEVMDRDPPAVTPTADQESVAWEMVRRGESSVAVVDDSGRFIGLVPPHRMLRVLLTERDEDVARLGGYLASTQRARLAPRSPSPAGSGTGFPGCWSGWSARSPRP